MLDPDFHKWTTAVGDRVIKSAISVWETLATEWCRSCLEDGERDRIVNEILKVLDQ
jgi:hypothetical protein